MSLRTIVEFEAPLPDGTPRGVLVAHELDRPFEDVRVTADGRLMTTDIAFGKGNVPSPEPTPTLIDYTGFIHLNDESHSYVALFDHGHLTSVRSGLLGAFVPDNCNLSDVLGILRMAFSERREPPPASVRDLLANIGDVTISADS